MKNVYSGCLTCGKSRCMRFKSRYAGRSPGWLDKLRPLVFHIPYSARHWMPDEMIRRYCSLGSNLFCLFSTNILTHPFPGGVRYQDKRAPVMDINETFISRGRDNQKPFRLITTLNQSRP